MIARPILYSASMVCALLAGKKSQTRRMLKPQPELTESGWLQWRDGECAIDCFAASIVDDCPYGLPDDLLWVRESLCRNCEPDGRDDEGRGLWAARYAADHTQVSEQLALGLWCPLMALHGFRRQPRGFSVPSIHMPMPYSRITQRITSVRVERLQDISEADAIAEGICYLGKNVNGIDMWAQFGAIAQTTAGLCADVDFIGRTAQEAYRKLWESINGKASWAANPWVWAISADTLKQNVDQVMRQAA
jgi:hypothetical protein